MDSFLISSPVVLSLKKVVKSFGSLVAVDHLDLAIHQGTVCALLGANGAGKTTLLKMIASLVEPDSGEIVRPLEDKKNKQPWFSFVPEESGLYDRMRVDDTILYFARLSGMSLKKAKQEMDPWLERFQIDAKRKRRVHELSKGNQQKVKMICALISRPPFLILDEPFTGLDGEGSALLRLCLDSLKKEGTTILLSSHRLDLIDLLADHLIVIAAGKKILDDTLKEARLHYRQNRIEVMFSSPPPSLDGLPGVIDLEWSNEVVKLALGPAAHSAEILQALLARGCDVENFRRHSPDLSEIIQAASDPKKQARGDES